MSLRATLAIRLFTAEIRGKILNAIRACVPPVMAARAANVPEGIWNGWKRRGEKYRKAPTKNAELVDFYNFMQDVESAQAIAAASMIQELRNGTRKVKTKDKDGETVETTLLVAGSLHENYKWLLTRCPQFRNEFGTGQERGELSGPDGGAIAIAAAVTNVHLFLPEEDDSGDPQPTH